MADKVQRPINLQGITDIPLDKRKGLVRGEVGDILPAARKEIVDRDDLVAFGQKPVR
jgi:hypothetical protein